MIDKRKEMDKMLEEYGMITGYFNARIDIAPMNNNALVEYAKKYAYSLEYKIDEERGVLALHQRISELQDEIDMYNAQYQNDQAQIRKLDSDPKAIKKIARERYFMKADDEDIFVLSDDNRSGKSILDDETIE